MKSTPKVEWTTLVVEGTGRFPLDMLRYDQCFPLSESDSYLLDNDKRSLREVHLRRVSYGRPASKERWGSFGWRVVSEHLG